MERLWVIQKRKKKGFSQKETAEKVGISQPSYCDIEHGKINPSVKTAKAIAEVLGFDWTKFFE